jgi:hypothetical protein
MKCPVIAAPEGSFLQGFCSIVKRIKMLNRVVVTGIGALTPIGNTVETFWNNVVAGKSGAGIITKFDASLFRTHLPVS